MEVYTFVTQVEVQRLWEKKTFWINFFSQVKKKEVPALKYTQSLKVNIIPQKAILCRPVGCKSTEPHAILIVNRSVS